jgi:hypothetical protein
MRYGTITYNRNTINMLQIKECKPNIKFFAVKYRNDRTLSACWLSTNMSSKIPNSSPYNNHSHISFHTKVSSRINMLCVLNCKMG